MKNKFLIILGVCTITSAVFSGCGAVETFKEDLKEDAEWTRDNNAGGESYNEEAADKLIKALGGTEKPDEKEKFAIGDVVSFTTDNGGETELVLKDWETVVDDKNNSILCINYMIKNIGDVEVEIGNGQFRIYADDSKVKQMRSGENVIESELISSGRKISGTLYAKVDVKNITTLEVEYGNAVFEVIGK